MELPNFINTSIACVSAILTLVLIDAMLAEVKGKTTKKSNLAKKLSGFGLIAIAALNFYINNQF